MKHLAIIPARSGSKGVKDKNIRPLNGRPLIAYSIAAAAESGLFDEITVSTDSAVYAETAKTFGASVPFLRSAATATDGASSWDVVQEVLDGYKKLGREFDTFCLLQPTSPLRTAEDIRLAYRLFLDKAAGAVVSVCPTEHSPLLCGRLPEDGALDGFVRPENLRRRQDLETYYRLNGAIYIVGVERFQRDRFLFTKDSYAYIMPQERSVDIDAELDFRLAEAILNA